MPKPPSASRSLRTLLGNRALPAYIRTLSPGVLAKICSRIGLSDAAELMALAPAQQLVEALDASVWKTPRPGLSEVFDSRELLEWLAVWLDIGDEFTAERLEVIPEADLTLYFSHVLRVATVDMWGFERSTEIEDLDRIYAPSYHESVYGQYVATATEPSHWETVRAALDALWRHSPERLLHVFSLLVGDESMLAPETHRESSQRDFVSQRETTRERQGHVTAAGARAFLTLANAPLNDLLVLSHYDLETSRHLNVIEDANERQIGGAGFATQDELTALPGRRTSGDQRRQPSPLVTRLAELADDDPQALDTRSRELAYLANVLIAAVALESRPITPAEAQEAALATCSLGLELIEKPGEDARIGQQPGLVRPFLVGWQTLGRLPSHVVDHLGRSLARLLSSARLAGQLWMLDDAASNLVDVRAAVSKRDFAAAREAALLLSFVFQPRACRAVVPLLDELPHLGGKQDGAPPQWLESLADLRRIEGLLRRIDREPRR